MAERGVGKHAEYGGKRRADTVAHNTAGKLFIGSFAAHAAFHAARNVAHGFYRGNNEHNHDRQNSLKLKDRFNRHEFRNREPFGFQNLIPVQYPGFGIFNTFGRDTGRGQEQGQNGADDVTENNSEQDAGGTGDALGGVLEDQDNSHNRQSNQKVFNRTVIRGRISAAERGHTYADQRKSDGEHDGSGNDGREEFAQRLQENTEDRFKQAAQNTCAHNGAVSDHAAAHRFRNAGEHADKTGACSHNNRNFSADRADGKKLDQRNNAGDEHGVLQQRNLQGHQFTAVAGRRNDEDRREVADKHGENVLQSQRNRLMQRKTAFKFIGGTIFLGLSWFLHK